MADLDVRAIDVATGKLLRELTIDPIRSADLPAGHPGSPGIEDARTHKPGVRASVTVREITQ
jgi:hypothetical protein